MDVIMRIGYEYPRPFLDVLLPPSPLPDTRKGTRIFLDYPGELYPANPVGEARKQYGFEMGSGDCSPLPHSTSVTRPMFSQSLEDDIQHPKHVPNMLF